MNGSVDPAPASGRKVTVFKARTVFILGAGASMPYSFPSGGELLTKIVNEAMPRMGQFGFDADRIGEFSRLLTDARPLSVDAFLETQQDFRELGKTAIAWSLLHCEDPNGLRHFPRTDWYDWVLNRIADGATKFDKLHDNQVSFITFNYDRSLEHFLYTAILSRYKVDSKDVAQLFKHIKIVHVHGQLGFLPWQSPDAGSHVGYGERTDDAIVRASVGIKIISEPMEADAFRPAHELIDERRL